MGFVESLGLVSGFRVIPLGLPAGSCSHTRAPRPAQCAASRIAPPAIGMGACEFYYLNVSKHIYIHLYIRKHLYLYQYLYLSIYLSIYIYIHIYTCMYIYMYIYIATHVAVGDCDAEGGDWEDAHQG